MSETLTVERATALVEYWRDEVARYQTLSAQVDCEQQSKGYALMAGDAREFVAAFEAVIALSAAQEEARKLRDDAERWRLWVRNLPAREVVYVGWRCSRYAVTLLGDLTIPEWIDQQLAMRSNALARGEGR